MQWSVVSQKAHVSDDLRGIELVPSSDHGLLRYLVSDVSSSLLVHERAEIDRCYRQPRTNKLVPTQFIELLPDVPVRSANTAAMQRHGLIHFSQLAMDPFIHHKQDVWGVILKMPPDAPTNPGWLLFGRVCVQVSTVHACNV